MIAAMGCEAVERIGVHPVAWVAWLPAQRLEDVRLDELFAAKEVRDEQASGSWPVDVSRVCAESPGRGHRDRT